MQAKDKQPRDETILNKFYGDLYDTLISILNDEELMRLRKRLDIRQRRNPTNSVKDFVLMEELTNEILKRELVQEMPKLIQEMPKRG